ncbi:MAG: DNA alkylation repair protein [Minisyncoccales bacterium]
MIEEIKRELRIGASKEKALGLQKFFKTGPGEYAEGDKFLGAMVPQIRAAIKKYWEEISPDEAQKLLKSEFHEERMAALLILVKKFQKGDDKTKRKIFDLYLKNTKYVNNWDLVDLTAPQIVGGYLEGKDKNILFELARSKSLWERRVAMLATFFFIKNGDCRAALGIAELLLGDKEDLIHKAVGWALREIGKRCGREIEEDFLNKHYETMPRMMLRYAIEKFSGERREHYMKRASLKHSSMVK